jgi:hypothetical protein
MNARPRSVAMMQRRHDYGSEISTSVDFGLGSSEILVKDE